MKESCITVLRLEKCDRVVSSKDHGFLIFQRPILSRSIVWINIMELWVHRFMQLYIQRSVASVPGSTVWRKVMELWVQRFAQI